MKKMEASGYETLPEMIELLRSSKDPTTLFGILKVIGQYDHEKESLGAVGLCLRHPDSLVRLQALYALRELNVPGAAKAVRSLVNSKEPDEQVLALAKNLLEAWKT